MALALPQCFLSSRDWQAELLGKWRTASTSPACDNGVFSCRSGNRTAQVAQELDHHAAQRWHQAACFAEDTVNSCFYHGDARAVDASRLTFEPDECVLAGWDARALVRELGSGRPVTFAGDSMMRQLFVSFVCHLASQLPHWQAPTVSWNGPRSGTHWNSLSNCPFDGDEHCYAESGCARFQGLAPICLIGAVHDGKTGPGGKVLGFVQQLLGPCAEAKGSICIFNLMGQHFDFNQAKRNAYAAHINATLAFVRFHLARTQFIFVEEPPQHFATPDGSYPASRVTGERCVPRGHNVPTQQFANAVAVPLMRHAGVFVMTIEAAALSVWDAHVERAFRANSSDVTDCTHWCSPGVPDAWSRQLFNMLLMLEHAPRVRLANPFPAAVGG